MTNEILWFLFALVNFGLILLSYKLFGKMGLFTWIAFGTILANIQVTKQIELFGVGATLGNIMYGTLFLATDALGEIFDEKAAKKAVYVGFFATISALIIIQMALLFVPSEYDFAQGALVTIFKILPRVTIASLLAYIISQTLDVKLFAKIRSKFPDDKYLWLRNNGSTIISQLIDTMIFVPIAFLGASGYSNQIVLEIFITTYIIKLVVALLDTPFLYLIKKIKPLE